MNMVTREAFADEKSRQIFDYRFKYYQTGNMEHILEMVIKEYRDFSRRVSELKEKIFNKLDSFDGNFIIYGAGVHAGLTMEYLQRNGLDNRVTGYCVSDNTRGGGGMC